MPLMVNTLDALPVPPALLAFTVTVLVVAIVGIPETTPVLVLRLKPGGNVPLTVKFVGLLLAVIV